MQPSSNKKERKSKIPIIFIACGAFVLAIAAGLLLSRPTPVSATPSFLGLAEAQYPFIVGSRIDTCDLCHVPNSIPNLNAYGTDFLNHGLNAAALVAIENLDSDGDGFTNIQELHAFTFPGDPNNKPPANTAAPTSLPTTAPSNTPTNTPTSVPTTAPSNTPTNTPTSLPTTAPTGVVTNTPTPVPTIVETTETPVPSATITPLPSGTVVAPTAVAPCLADVEKNEHVKKSHGKSEEQMSASEEASEERVCEEQEGGNEIEEAHESAQAQLHERENGENEKYAPDESDQTELDNQENQGQQQEGSSSDQSFINSIDLWLSQWFRSTSFHG